MKRLFLSLLVLVGMLFTSVVAYAEDYNVWIDDIQVTSSNANDVLGDGTVRWLNASNTLILYNADINSSWDAIYFALSNTDVKIIYYGTNTITASSCGISLVGNHSTLTIESGSGSQYGVPSLIINADGGIRLGSDTDCLMLSQNHASGLFKITATNKAIKCGNLILKNMAGYNSNNVIKTTNSNAVCIDCKALYTGGDVHDTFSTPCTTSYPKAMTIEGKVIILDNQFDLNKQSPGMVYVRTPVSPCVTGCYIYDLSTNNPATNIIINPRVTARYHIWVKGVEVTSNNARDILGDGTASYDANTSTLTLNNFRSNLDYTHPFYLIQHVSQNGFDPIPSLIYYGPDASSCKIKLQGNNTTYLCHITPNTVLTNIVPYFLHNESSSDVIFEGDGSLTVVNACTETTNRAMIYLDNNNKTRFNGTGKIMIKCHNNSQYISNSNIIVDDNNYQAYWSKLVTTTQANSTVVTKNIEIAGITNPTLNNARIIYLEPAHDLYVADVRVDDFNKTDIAARSNKLAGTINYNSTAKTLSFNNATINYDGSATGNTTAAVRNYGSLSNTTFNIFLTGNNNITLSQNTEGRLYGIFYGTTLKGTGNLNINVTNTGVGSARGIDGDVNLSGSGAVTITVSNHSTSRAILGNISAASGYNMRSGATASTATIKNPIPTTSTDNYVHFELNSAAPLTITDGPELDIPASIVGKPITRILLCDNVSGGTAPYQYSATGLPAGITINASTGIISGTPTAAKAAGTATIQVKDALNNTASVTIAYGKVSPVLTFTYNAAMNIPASIVGVAIANINCKPYVTGGKQPYTFLSFNLPEGISINASTGIISGTPITAQQATQAEIIVEDANNDTQSVTISVGAVTTSTTAIDNVNNNQLIVWSNNGFIGCSIDEYTIYNANGLDVTIYNGKLVAGTYFVRTADGVAKITIK